MMDIKKVSKLHSLRKKMLPRFRRDKKNSDKRVIQPDHNMDHRMSISVPDMTVMRQDQQSAPSCNGYELCDEPDASLGRCGSGLQVPDEGALRNYHRLSMPSEWVLSQEPFNGLCEENNFYLENNSSVRGMEPETVEAPETTAFSPDDSPDSTQSEIGNEAESENNQDPPQSFLLNIRLKEGQNLVIRDRCGTSDPYVKFKLEDKTVYKSKVVYKNLNPAWNETFYLPVKDLNQKIYIKVYDRDLTSDDFMGSAFVLLTELEIDKLHEMTLQLNDPNTLEEDMGFLLVDMTLSPRNEDGKKGIVGKAQGVFSACVAAVGITVVHFIYYIQSW